MVRPAVRLDFPPSCFAVCVAGGDAGADWAGVELYTMTSPGWSELGVVGAENKRLKGKFPLKTAMHFISRPVEPLIKDTQNNCTMYDQYYLVLLCVNWPHMRTTLPLRDNKDNRHDTNILPLFRGSISPQSYLW